MKDVDWYGSWLWPQGVLEDSKAVKIPEDRMCLIYTNFYPPVSPRQTTVPYTVNVGSVVKLIYEQAWKSPGAPNIF